MAQATQDATASYLTDLLAIEQHLQKALAGQIDDLESDALDMGWELSRIHETCRRHTAALDELVQRREQAAQGFRHSVRKAASSVLGLGSAAIELVRTDKLPESLRDDFAGVSMACIGYVMLHTTATALGDIEAADLAQRHLKSHAKSAMALQGVVPLAVMQVLRDDGLPVRENVLPDVSRNVRAAWMPEESVTATFSREP